MLMRALTPEEAVSSLVPGHTNGSEDKTAEARDLVASFPGSHAREREHWSCASVEPESLVFFVTWKARKIDDSEQKKERR